MSGAFGLFRKQTVIDVGGYKRNTIGEDMEIVVRIHRYMRKNRKKYRVKFDEFSICWTQGPMSMQDIRSQRRRWQIGLMDTLISHIGMTFNPRYGFVGLISVPYNWIFELLGAVVEVIGYLPDFCFNTVNRDIDKYREIDLSDTLSDSEQKEIHSFVSKLILYMQKL